MNDQFRMSGFGVTVTRGVLFLDDVEALLREVWMFDAFTAVNDPYAEHDFGSIIWQGGKAFWKIDYFEQRLEYGEEPLSSECRRILTVMLASEY